MKPTTHCEKLAHYLLPVLEILIIGAVVVLVMTAGLHLIQSVITAQEAVL